MRQCRLFSLLLVRAANEDVEGPRVVADASAEHVQAWFLLQHCFSIPSFLKHNLETPLLSHFLLSTILVVRVSLNIDAMN